MYKILALFQKKSINHLKSLRHTFSKGQFFGGDTVFVVADHESVFRFAKFKMADPIWRTI